MAKREIQRDQLIKFLDDFSKRHEGWIVTWEVLGSEFGDQAKATRPPLVGISADVKGRTKRIAITVGGSPETHVTQFIDRPKRVWVRDPREPGHEAVEVESDGTTRVLTFHPIDPGKAERELMATT